MTSESRYQAARIVSRRVAYHFEEQIKLALKNGEKTISIIPEEKIIEEIIDISFWASLQKEEGRSPKISLALLPPELADKPLVFSEKIPFTTRALIKLSPGVERPGVHLGVWHENGALYVWGTLLKIPNFCFVLDVSEPGLLVIKHRRAHGFWKFANVAVLIGDQIKIVDEKLANNIDTPDVLKALLGLDGSAYWNDSINILVQLATSMRAHKHGGILLIVNPFESNWKNSIIHPMKYSVTPGYSGITRLMSQEVNERGQNFWQDAMRKELDSIAGLTAVDGATVMNSRYELLAFGTKITRPDGRPQVDLITYIEPVVNSEILLINPAIAGGTRHLSAAQFINDQRDALALVASQDGHFTLFTWSNNNNMVQAHRIDTLLL